MKTKMLIILLALTTEVFAQDKKTAAPNAVKHKVAIQLTSNEQGVWNLLMNEKSTQKEKIAEFKKQGVSFVACENTMKKLGLKKEEIVPEAGYVATGIGELILKQEQGWAYVKAGF